MNNVDDVSAKRVLESVKPRVTEKRHWNKKIKIKTYFENVVVFIRRLFCSFYVNIRDLATRREVNKFDSESFARVCVWGRLEKSLKQTKLLLYRICAIRQQTYFFFFWNYKYKHTLYRVIFFSVIHWLSIEILNEFYRDVFSCVFESFVEVSYLTIFK